MRFKSDKQRRAAFANMNKEYRSRSVLQESQDAKELAEHFGATEKPRESVDEAAVREIALWTENDADIYRQRITPFIKNFARKMKKGTYRKDLATQAMADYVIKDGIKSYNKSFVYGYVRLNPKERLEAAKQIIDSIEEQAKYESEH